MPIDFWNLCIFQPKIKAIKLSCNLSKEKKSLFFRYPCYNWPKSAPGVPPSYTSHVEGWGLYAEYLGFEMGMFEDPHQKIGFYSWNLLRAGRLVVDTGIHAFGWSRDRAIQYLLDNTGLSKSNIEGQVDR